MGLDAMKPAENLDATQEEMTPREKQNKFGQKHVTVPDVGDEGFLSILAVKTGAKLTPAQFFEIKTYLETHFGVTGMQALFEIDIPEPEEGYQNNLHTSAHVRQDQKPASVETLP